jgi:hypothetical protein
VGSYKPGFFYRTRVGRVLLGSLSAGLVAVLIMWNLPDPDLRDSAQDHVRPVVNALVINQGWGLFAPNPTRTSARVYAEVTFSDGEREVFDFPDGEPFVGALREFRWRKLERRLRQEKNSGLWRPVAQWIEREVARPDVDVTRVELVRQESRLPTAGSGKPLVWQIERFHTYVPAGTSSDESVG